jgi:carboxymethylenebutenolidase
MMQTLGSAVVIPPDDGSPATPAYSVLAPRATKGVVVIHEAFGPQPEIERVVHRFAAGGYAAVAPDLFASGRVRCVRDTMEAMRTGTGPAVRQALAVRRWLGAQAGVAEARVGIIGFCFGGGFALAVGRGWGAVSTNYGAIPAPEALRGLGPTIGCFGGRDRIFGRHGAVLEARLRAAGVEVEAHTYPDAGHSFLTDGKHPLAAFFSAPLLRIGSSPESSADAWEKILAFFDRHLGAADARG